MYHHNNHNRNEKGESPKLLERLWFRGLANKLNIRIITPVSNASTGTSPSLPQQEPKKRKIRIKIKKRKK